MATPIAQALRRGHPWVFANRVHDPSGSTGGFVRVLDPSGGFVAHALFDPSSGIALRVLSLQPEPLPGYDLWLRRFADAAALRRRLFAQRPGCNAYRLCHGEGDGLPGVVVDRYDEFLVLKLDAVAWLPQLDGLVAALCANVPCRGVFFKGLRRNAGESETGRVVWGEPPPELIDIEEDGLRFAVDVRRGQKTGFFLDQRDNRALVRGLSRGLDVVNLFAYTGAFSVAAAVGGARQVLTLDQATDAVDEARRNFTRNGIDPSAHSFVAADAFTFLERAEPGSADLVIVDPPAMAPSERTRPQALKTYTRLNALALRMLRSGGLLASASCSSHVRFDDFLEAVREAGDRAGRPLSILEKREQPADHPTGLAFPEGRYLKFLLARA